MQYEAAWGSMGQSEAAARWSRRCDVRRLKFKAQARINMVKIDAD